MKGESNLAIKIIQIVALVLWILSEYFVHIKGIFFQLELRVFKSGLVFWVFHLVEFYCSLSQRPHPTID